MSDELSAEVLALIRDEEQALAAVMDSLHLQLSRGKVRLTMETERARELNNQIVSSTRGEDKAALASDEAVSYGLSNLKRSEVSGLDALLDQPYFARIVLEERNPRGERHTIEYKLGLQSNIDCRIVDWRKAPISKLYYEYREGDEYFEEIQGVERQGRVLLRNKLEIRDGTLVQIDCRHGAFAFRDGGWRSVDGERRTRGASGYRQLPDVLSLITKEQFRMITEEANTAVIIQGVAGSGKTTVALHRLAWLLHKDNSDVRPEECLVLTKSRALMEYTKQSLTVLGIRGANVNTYFDWADQSLQQIQREESIATEFDQKPVKRLGDQLAPPGVSRVKRSMAMLKAIESYAEYQMVRLVELLSGEVQWERLPASIAKSFGRYRPDAVAPAQALPLRLIEDLIGQISSSRRRNEMTGDQAQYAEAVLAFLERLRRKLTLYREDVIAVLERPENILRFDETKLLDRELISAALEFTKRCKEERIPDEDDEALMLRLFELKNGFVVQRLSRNDANANVTGRYRFIVVDEVQDFSPVELSSVIGAVDDVSHLTLVGDSAQEIGAEATFPGWDTLRKHWRLGDSLSQFITLSISHRSTLPIMRLADHVIGSRRTTDGRNGKPPLWYRSRTEENGVREAIGWLTRVSKRYPGGLALTLCRTPAEAQHVASLLEPTFGAAVRLGTSEQFSFEEGILVSDVAQVKGLEFENVLIWNPSMAAYPPSTQNQKLLYVAITRAEEHLCLVTWGRESSYLPSPRSPLLRVIEQEEEVTPAAEPPLFDR